jgi:hypothetical protein
MEHLISEINEYSVSLSGFIMHICQRLNYLLGWSGTASTLTEATLFWGLLYQTWVMTNYDCGANGEMNEWQGKLKYWEETLTQCRFVHHKYYLI